MPLVFRWKGYRFHFFSKKAILAKSSCPTELGGLREGVERAGIEPATSGLQSRRSPS